MGQFKLLGWVPVNAPESARGKLDITYVDEDLRISRGDKGVPSYHCGAAAAWRLKCKLFVSPFWRTSGDRLQRARGAPLALQPVRCAGVDGLLLAAALRCEHACL